MQHSKKISVLLVFIFFGLNIFGAWHDGFTMDEPIYLAVSHALVKYGAIHLNPFHPPLVKLIAGLSIAILPLHQVALAPLGDAGILYAYSSQWLAANSSNIITILFFARTGVVIFNTFLLFVSLRQIQNILGDRASIIYGILLIFSPLFLGHSRYLTFDTGCALLSIIAAISCFQFLEAKTCRAKLFCFLSCLAAFLVKFQTLFIIPIIILTIIFRHYRSPKVLFDTLVKFISILFLISIVITAAYGVLLQNAPPGYINQYQSRLSTEGSPIFHQAIQRITAYRALDGIRWYTVGALSSFNLTKRIKHQHVLLGNTRYVGGSVLFFPLLFALKESTASMLLLFCIITMVIVRAPILVRQWSSISGQKKDLLLFCVLFTPGYLAIAITSNLNIGLRHILPMYPPLILTFLIVAPICFQVEPQEVRKRSQVIVAMLLALHILDTLLSFPHMLSKTNIFAQILYPNRIIAVDSDFDWGQDSLRLTEYVQQHGLAKVYVDIVTPLDLGIDGTAVQYTTISILNRDSLQQIPPGATVAISLSRLEILRHLMDQAHPWTLDQIARTFHLRPIALIGETIALFEFKKEA